MMNSSCGAYVAVRPLAVVLLLSLASAAGASSPRPWRQASSADFASGTLEGVSVSAAGEVTAGLATDQLAALEQVERIWCLVRGLHGETYVGTGDQGRVLRLDGSGEVVWTFDSPEVGIHSLLWGTDGQLYAGTAPDGLVYRIDPDTGEGTTLCRSGARYVWDLAQDEHGRLYAATGQPGTVLALESDGTPKVIFRASAQHVMCVAAREGGLVAGTAVPARIYALSCAADSAAGRLLFQAPQAEIQALAPRDDGSLLASAVPASSRGDSIRSQAAVYAVAPDGAVRLVFQAKKAKTLALATGPGRRTYLLTDSPPRLCALDSTGACSILMDFQDQTFSALRATSGGALLLGAAQSGRILQVGPGIAEKGDFLSSVEDFGGHARWGHITWDAEVPPHARLTVSTRSGNSPEPDASWSVWSAGTEDSGSTVGSPPARYLQYRLHMEGQRPGSTIAVREVLVFGQQTNLPPVVTEFAVEPYRPRQSGSANQDPVQAAVQNTRLRPPPPARSLMVLHWKTSDPNEDQLSYRIYLRGAGQKTWKLAGKDIRRNSIIWDTFPMPEGVTRAMLVASDAPDNSPGEALEAREVAAPFLLDHSPPSVEVSADTRDGTVRLTARMEDRFSAVVEADYSIDYESDEIFRLRAADGLFDSTSEEADFRIRDLPPGEHVVVVRAKDQRGNVGVGQVLVDIP